MTNRTLKASRFQRGFTLIEVLMSVVIIGILAAVAMRSVQSAVEGSRIRETQSEMDELINAVAGNPNLYNNGMRSDFGYVGDVGGVPSTMDDLITNPGGYATWDGPYVSRRFSEDADGFKKDAWGNLYTFTSGITVASTGGGATAMTKSAATASVDLTSTPIAGTVTDAAGNPPGDSSVAVTVTVTYPDGSGATTTASANPSAGGTFTISAIPVGVRNIQAVYRATDDTVSAYASLLPKTGATVSLRLPGAPFAGIGGGGGGGAQIEYLAGSATSPSFDIRFTIWNSGNAGVSISWIRLTYAPVAYFRYIRWAGTIVFNETAPRGGSGDQCNFSSAQILGVGQSVQLRVEDFRATAMGGTNVDMSNVDFTVEFSNGQSVTFNSN